MASASRCGVCMRRLVRSQPSDSLRHTSRSFSSTSRSYTVSTAPLYLDFLAPSWKPTARVPLQSTTPRNIVSTSRDRLNTCTSRRAFSQTRARPDPAKPILNPRLDDDGNEMVITITPRAAHRLRAIATKDSNPDLALRVSVESGGCHGFQYLMNLVNTQKDVDAEEDTLFEEGGGDEGVYRAKVVMDEPSLEMLKGSSVDYTMELIGSQFKVVGIPGATSSCGCGTSFDVAA